MYISFTHPVLYARDLSMFSFLQMSDEDEATIPHHMEHSARKQIQESNMQVCFFLGVVAELCMYESDGSFDSLNSIYL